MAGFDRNQWPTSIGIGGRIASESVAGFDRNPHPWSHDPEERADIIVKARALVDADIAKKSD